MGLHIYMGHRNIHGMCSYMGYGVYLYDPVALLLPKEQDFFHVPELVRVAGGLLGEAGV